MRELRTEATENQTGIMSKSEERIGSRAKTAPCDPVKALREENERLAGENKDLKMHLGDLEAAVDRMAREAGQASGQTAKQQSAGSEMAGVNEEFAKIEIKLTKLKRKLIQDQGGPESGSLLGGVSITKPDRSPAVVRKNISLLIEVVSGLVDQQATRCQDLSIDAKEARKELLSLKSETHALNSELESVRADFAALETELEHAHHDVSLLEERCEELNRENKALAQQNDENPLATELGRKVDQLESVIERLREENETAETRCGKLKRFLADERVHFYVENYARCQAEIRGMEKRQLRLELRLAKSEMTGCSGSEQSLRVS